MKRNYITIGILVALIAAFAVSRIGHIGYPTAVDRVATTTVTTTIKTPAQPTAAPAATTRVTAPTPTATSPAQSPANNITLKIGDQTYGAYIAANESVLSLMHALTSSTDLTFTGEEYPSLGFFVKTIDGKANADGYYWILYVNGKSSDTGASQTTLKEGDIVEWRYEKSY